jgi:hypothetical protein
MFSHCAIDFRDLPSLEFGHHLVSECSFLQILVVDDHSYIPYLDPDLIKALAGSVLHFQVEPLRDAIYKHLAAINSIKVRLPVCIFISLLTGVAYVLP